MNRNWPSAALAVLSILILGLTQGAIAQSVQYVSHASVRPLPTPTTRPLSEGPAYFVDPTKGADANTGAKDSPWKSIAHSLRRLKPGDTLVLRGGTYYEHLAPTKSGTPDAPITIRSYPGEMAIIDGGLREFFDDPQHSWEPLAGGADGEYVSTRAYPDTDARVVPFEFMTALWEPMAGIEDERPLALGNFGDSMIPLHGYRTLEDLRSKNEHGVSRKHGTTASAETSMYCGPGMWYDRDTGLVHIRLAHTKLQGLGDNAYKGETDPRKIPLVVALGFGQEVIRITGVNNLHIEDLVFRGAKTGSPSIHLYGSQNIVLDHDTVFGGNPGLLVNAVQHLKVLNCVFRGLAAPWTSRAHMKYRGTASYIITLQDNQPENKDLEIGNCEFTDGHDFAAIRFAWNLKFHHNYVENFNDDGLEMGPKVRDHLVDIYQNWIRSVEIPITQHESRKDESPLDQNPNTGVYMYRNIIDTRPGTYSTPPMKDDPTGAYLHVEEHLAGDHGSPIWPVYRFYQNTVLRQTPAARNYFLMGLGNTALAHTERDVFNNIMVQTEGLPGNNFIGITPQVLENLHEGGNIVWSLKEGPGIKGDLFAKFRQTPVYQESVKTSPPGLTMQDIVADPLLVKLPEDWSQPIDLRLTPKSPAIDAGVPIPGDWPDTLRDSDKGKPDIGALPLDAQPWNVGMDGRFTCFGQPAAR